MDPHYDFNKICRTCLLEETEMFDIFDTNEITILSPFDILRSCTKIQVIENDAMPHQICRQCLYQANQSLLFQNQCEKSEIILKSYLFRKNNKDVNNKHNLGLKLEHDMSLENSDNSSSGNSYEYNIDSRDIDTPSQLLQITVKTELDDDQNETRKSQHLLREADDAVTCDLSIQSQPIEQKGKTMKCTICSKMFKYPNCFEKHMLTHSIKLQIVKRGNRTFKSRIIKQFKQMINTHKNDNENNDSAKVLVKSENVKASEDLACDLCNKSFNRPCNLRRHMLLHQGKKSHLCNMCGKAFTQSAYLRIHMRTHSNERPHRCTICSRGFKQRSSLNVHYLTHTNIRSHVCSICGKTFKWNAVLKTHMLSHTDERKYECTVCGSKFKIMKHLTRHVLTHTGEKKHSCPTCGKCFNRASNLRVHYKIHTGERPFSCTVCEKAFLYKHCLQNHMKTHEC